jgi:hypothetical protein
VSYVGGPGGLTARPTTEEQRVMHEHHTSATPVQVEHRAAAGARPELVASVNHGKPEIAATSKPNDFQAHVTGASRAGGPVPVHVRDLPAAPSPSKSAANQEAEYQRQQSALQARHQQEREALAQMQERDHAYQTQQHANAGVQAQAQAQAALEHQHRQQTEFLQQRQASEMQSLHAPSTHAPPPPRGEPTRH